MGIEGDDVLLSPYGATDGLSYGQPVQPLRRHQRAPVGGDLLGRVIDGLGKALDDGPDPEDPGGSLMPCRRRRCRASGSPGRC
ncbi:hypothetical protein SODG_004509 [Sodalis praecaptivus]